MHAVQKLLLATALAASVLTGCSESPPPAATAATPPAAAPAPVVATPPPAPAAPTAVVVASDSAVTGIAECDDFLVAYEQCVTSKVPAEARDAMNTGLAQWKSSWRDMANNAATKASMPQMCQQARDASKPALQAYGCTF